MNKNKQKWISDKIKKLKSEGKSQEQSVAIAYSAYNQMLKGGMYEKEVPKYQGAGYIKNPLKFYSTEEDYPQQPNMVWNANLGQYTIPPSSINQSEKFVPFDSSIQEQGLIASERQVDPQLKNLNQEQIVNPNIRPELKPLSVYVKNEKGETPTAKEQLEEQANKTNSEIENTYFTQQQYYDENKENIERNNQMFNPFGGISLEASLAYAGQGFGSGQTGKGIMGSTLAGLKSARTFMSGFATGKEENRLQEEYYRRIQEDPNYIINYQEGGSIPYTDKELAYLNNSTGVTFTNEGAQRFNPKAPPLNIKPLDLGRYTDLDYFNIEQEGEAYVIKPSKNNLKNARDYKEDLRYIKKLNPEIEIKGIEDNRYYVPPNQRLQEGGRITNSELLTGKYLVEDPTQQISVELEDGEYAENSQTGEIKEVVGEKHDKGGVKTDLPNKSKIISDYTKIGKDNVKKFKEQFDVKVKATDTFATVLDKVNRNIGLDKLIEEEKSIYEKIEEQESDKSLKENVKKLNLKALQKNLQDISNSKQELEIKQKEAFDSIFEAQEKIPKKGNKEVMKEGGIMNQDLEFLSKKYKLDKNKLMDLVEMQGGGYTNRTRLKDWLDEAKGLGFEGEIDLDSDNLGEEVGKLQTFFAENFPEEVLNYFQEQPINAKGVEQLKKNNPEIFDKLGVPKNKKPTDYTNEERLKLQNQYRNDNPNERDFWLDQFQDNTWNVNNTDTWRTIVVGNQLKQHPSTIQTNLQAELPNQTPKTQTAVEENGPQQDIQQKIHNERNRSTTNIPIIPQDFILPPSARQPVYKQSVQMGRIDPVKVSAEPNLVEIERQRQALDEATRFLPPAQRASVMANALGQTQSATNQAVSQTEATNAQAQYNADLYNLQARAKEDLLNARFEQDYEAKTMAAIGNQELDVRQYFNDLNNQQRYNFEYIDRRNLLNQAFPNYNVSGSSNIGFTGGSDFQDITKYFNSLKKSPSQMTDEEYDEYVKTSMDLMQQQRNR